MSTAKMLAIGGGVAAVFAIVGGAAALAIDAAMDARDRSAHEAACRRDENRHNYPDDGQMREIPQRCGVSF